MNIKDRDTHKLCISIKCPSQKEKSLWSPNKHWAPETLILLCMTHYRSNVSIW